MYSHNANLRRHSLRPVAIVDNILSPLSHFTHFLDRPQLESMTWGEVRVFERAPAEDVVGTLAVHLVSVLLRVVLKAPRADHGEGRTRPLLRWLEGGLMVLLAIFETSFLCTRNPFESVPVSQHQQLYRP